MEPLSMHIRALNEHLTPEKVHVDGEKICDGKVSRTDPFNYCDDAPKSRVFCIKPPWWMHARHGFNGCNGCDWDGASKRP